ncbi:hypothetical protein EDC56_1127 [Sinobacterium caligoides]|uniref:Uncharacterized protein n=1 Tax=Sinobacterium caligoides TaxID=933926 RepID=A0A3N2E0N0_9GAMM|nr:hypothetical protein [Sinobacterium caligoides]ROS05587.1 hypothetical protein EDC56_1127 [Sinobacterium caligoides]
MSVTKEDVTNSLGSFIAVAILFGGGWYYLDQQRLESIKQQEEMIKLIAEASVKEEEYKSRLKALEAKEKEIENKYKEQAHDNELSALTLKFIDEVSEINIHKKCGDDSEHNKKARKAKALLSLIESKALEYGRTELVETFIKDQWLGVGSWAAKCSLNK